MLLEVNLVKINSVDSQVGKLLDRKRYTYENDTDILDHIGEFLNDNADDLSLVITNSVFIDSIRNAKYYNITQFRCLRYALAANGLGLWVWTVDQDSQNPTEVADGTYEYNIVDCMDLEKSSFIPQASKFIASKDDSLNKLYNHVNEYFNLFSGDCFNGYKNPVTNLLDGMNTDEQVLGFVSGTKSTYFNTILESMDIHVKVIAM